MTDAGEAAALAAFERFVTDYQAAALARAAAVQPAEAEAEAEAGL
ncbi:MAG: hypothetical protein ACRDPY_08640 [Streptosporangiaceae bacterium]